MTWTTHLPKLCSSHSTFTLKKWLCSTCCFSTPTFQRDDGRPTSRWLGSFTMLGAALDSDKGPVAKRSTSKSSKRSSAVNLEMDLMQVISMSIYIYKLHSSSGGIVVINDTCTLKTSKTLCLHDFCSFGCLFWFGSEPKTRRKTSMANLKAMTWYPLRSWMGVQVKKPQSKKHG